MPKLSQLAADLAAGRSSSRQLVEESLTRIADPDGEGARAFISVNAEAATAAAEAMDQLRANGQAPSPLAGIPVSAKDLFDVAGQVTRAGSKVLEDQPPAKADAAVIARLKAAGLIIVGRTNMTEFAYSGIGMNPHFGTPKNPYERHTGRIPGGSSSGTAVSVTDGMAVAGLGTDTGGSCRIPAALCGIVGYKPTAIRVPLDGVAPLSFSLDSVGPLASSVECCAILDSILAGDTRLLPSPFPLNGMRLAVPQSLVLDDLDETVAKAFEEALLRLSAAGATIKGIAFEQLNELPEINAKGGLAAAEAYAWHRRHLERAADDYDPRVRSRILNGRQQDAADYIELKGIRTTFIRRARVLFQSFDALIMPTVPVIAPTLAELESDENYGRANLLMLRNPSVLNFLDGCAISLPCHEAGTAPVGLTLAGWHGGDRRLFSISRAVEAALSSADASQH
ncbi:MAG: amidase [Alphaproteobacteria bacterium]|jgi:aspartyl-tRNA(Asn)/glutamyl-tRNA(Gln) amidotransferase subunit A|nr:amidase [Alphaproteobacteria bacterium]HJP20849.1 amidase [Alphaproteobacteria bacterium]